MYVRPIGFWLKLVDALVDDAYTRLLDQHGLSREQWQLLDAMDAGPQQTAYFERILGPFAAHDGVSATPADHLDELVESGWVFRDGDTWSLTPTGRHAMDGLEAAVAAARDNALRDIPSDEYGRMLDTLERIAHNYGYRQTA